MAQHAHKEIIRLSLPAIVTNITTPLLALTDVAIAGHMGSASYIAAIAVGGSLFNMIYWLTGFLRMGCTGLTAQAHGAQDIHRSHRLLSLGITISLVIAAALLIFQTRVCNALLWLLDVDAETLPLARNYFTICIWGAPATLATMVFTGWFLGMQSTKIPMWISICIDLSNIAISLLLVYGFAMKIEGIAFGTLAAQYIGAFIALTICLRHYGIKLSSLISFRFATTDLAKYFRVNSDIFLRTLGLIAVTMWFTRVGAQQGAIMLAVNALLMQFFTLFSYFMDGFAFAGEALSGKYLGAGNLKALSATTSALMKIGVATSIIFSVVYFIFGDGLLTLLSSESDVTATATEYLLWAATIPFAGFMAFVYDGIMIGTTQTRRMLLSMIVGAITFFALYFLLFPHLGNHGLWLAFIAYLAVRGLAYLIPLPLRKV